MLNYTLPITPQYYPTWQAQRKLAAISAKKNNGGCWEVPLTPVCVVLALLQQSIFAWVVLMLFAWHAQVSKRMKKNPGWKAGRSVAYCEACFREKMEKEAENEVSGQESETGISVSSCSSCGGKSLESKATRPWERYIVALQARLRRQIRGFLFFTDTAPGCFLIIMFSSVWTDI